VNPILRIRVVLLVGNRLLSEALNRILRKRSDVLVMDQSLELSPSPYYKIGKRCTFIGLCQRKYLEPPTCDSNARFESERPGSDGWDGRGRECLPRAVRAGVSGYLLNDASAADVIAAIRAVSRGEAVCPAQLCKVLFDSVAGSSKSIPSVRNIGLRLTRRQQELLPMIARGQTNKEIASYLNLSEQTVKNHIHRMLRKMGANDRLQITEIAGIQDYVT
jgi:DNA-binding CsgD family transcriptional regulator